MKLKLYLISSSALCGMSFLFGSWADSRVETAQTSVISSASGGEESSLSSESEKDRERKGSTLSSASGGKERHKRKGKTQIEKEIMVDAQKCGGC